MATFFFNFFGLLGVYFMVRPFAMFFMSRVRLDDHIALQKKYLGLLKEHNELLDELAIAQERAGDEIRRMTMLDKAAVFWQVCYRHMLMQSPHSERLEVIMEEAEITLSEFLGEVREDLRKRVEEGLVGSGFDGKMIAKFMKDKFPND